MNRACYFYGMKHLLLFFATLLSSCLTCTAQENQPDVDEERGERVEVPADLSRFERKTPSALRLAFYNLENLFDTQDDTLINDEEFVSGGMKGWSETRFRHKINNHAKTLIALGGWEAPAIIGFCEVENREVIHRLITETSLKDINYQIIHENSPDRRGIDVCLIYRPDKIKIVNHHYGRVSMPQEPELRTRDFLYMKGVVFEKDTIHVFYNHWPSRMGGQQSSEPKRLFVAQLIRNMCDSLLKDNPNANILISGDLNDEPGDKSVAEVLKGKPSNANLNPGDFVNLMYEAWEKGVGTEKYQNHWGMLDQWLVSGALFKREKGLVVDGGTAGIFNAPWLIEKDERYLGEKPYRTFSGPKYLGGHSDHFPVYIDLVRTK